MDEKPKLESWSYDQAQTQNSPEMQSTQSASWSAVGESMAKDQKEHVMLRRGFTVTALIVIYFLGRFVAILGIIAALIVMIPIIITVVHGNNSPSKKYEVAFWVIITLIICFLII